MHKDDAFWSDARALIPLDPLKINLNAGTLWPTPTPILQAVAALRYRMAQNPSDFVWRQLPGLIEHSRARLADYLNCPTDELLLLPNVTYAINLVVASLQLPPGSEILTTDHEYGAMMYTWERWARQNGWTLKQLQLPYCTEDPSEIVDAFKRAISDKTRVVFFSHVNTTTGLAMPAMELCALAKARGILSIIDGAHAPGMIPVNLARIGADFYGANCHKWLMAPAGAGFLHVAKQLKPMLQPIITSWGWKHDAAKADENSGNGGSHWQWNLEFHGSVDRCPQMVLPECLDFRTRLGGDETILNRCRCLSGYAREQLALAGRGLRCITPKDPLLNGGALTAFDFPCDDVIKARDYFWHEHNIECPVTIAADKTFLRVSAAWFNTTEELDRLAEAVRFLSRESKQR